MHSRLAIRADLLHFTADPGGSADDAAAGVRHRADHWLLIEDGRIAGAQADARVVACLMLADERNLHTAWVTGRAATGPSTTSGRTEGA